MANWPKKKKKELSLGLTPKMELGSSLTPFFKTKELSFNLVSILELNWSLALIFLQ
jgi:hypothetical protein